MGLFRSRQSADVPPLVEAPKGGEPIVFDEKEQRAIDREIKYQYDNYYKDRIFPKDVAETMENAFAARALSELAKSKLHSGDLKGAASTCIKAVGLFPKYEAYWLLLAEIFAEHGDTVRSRGFLDTAKKVHKGNRDVHISEFEPVWKDKVQKVQDIIRSKESTQKQSR